MEKLLSFGIPTPPLKAQRRIADILSAYDDLIDVNQRRIAILEEMARRLFEEWFVRFRYPGHGDDLPDWPVETLASLAEIVGDTVNPSVAPDEVFAHYSIPQYDAEMAPAIEVGDGIRSNKTLIPKGVVLVSKLNPRLPRVWTVDDNRAERRICSTEFVPLRPTGRSLYWLASAVSSQAFQQYLAGHANGTSTSHQRVKPADILAFPVRVPSADVLSAAERHLQAFGRQVALLRNSKAALRAARDLLLPKLISGEIELSAAPALDDITRDAA